MSFHQIVTVKKTQAILLLEAVALTACGILVETLYFDGFSVAVGPLRIQSHNLGAPAIFLAGAVLLRRLLVGSFTAPLFLPAALHQLGNRLFALAHKFVQPLSASPQFRQRRLQAFLLLLVATGLVAVSNPLPRGLIASYYANAAWSGAPRMVVREPFDGLARMKRAAAFATEEYSIEWQGVIRIAAPGTHEFTTVSDDGSELYLDEQLVVANGGQHNWQERRGVIALERGFHAIRLRYMQHVGFAGLKVFWSPPGTKGGQAGQKLAAAALFPATPAPAAWWLGQGLEILLTLLKWVWGALLSGLLVLGLRDRQRLFPAAPNAFVGGVIFMIVFISHFFWSPVTTSFDSRWSVHTAFSLLKEGNANLDEYRHILRQQEYYAIERLEQHFYTKYPLGTSLLALPFVYLGAQLLEAGLNMDLYAFLNENIPEGMEAGIASILVAAAAILIFLISALFAPNLKSSLLLTFIFAFCTSAWSTASRALWQHGPSLLVLTAALYLALRVRVKPTCSPWPLQLMGFLLAFAFVIRPTNSIPILIFTLYVLLNYPRAFFPYCFWGLVVAIPFVSFNWQVYHALLPKYYLTASHFTGPPTPFLEALAGVLVSPSRGLFTFSPVLLLAFYGIALKMRSPRRDALDYAILAILALHLILLGLFPCWWGGHSYGPRLTAEMLPYLLYFCIPALAQIPRLQGLKKQVVILFLGGALAISFYIHYRGATSWEVYEWNTYPVPVEAKLWDWPHRQFLQGM